MNEVVSTPRIDTMRASARNIVRKLGFMQKSLAGTNLSPSAVHSIIELGLGNITTARELGRLLHLEKSTVSRLVQKLENEQLIKVLPDHNDKRSRKLTLTEEGQKLLSELERFGRRQFEVSLDNLDRNEVEKVETGLDLFSKALGNEILASDKTSNSTEIRQGYHPGIISAVTQLHTTYYSENYGFGSVFERKVATEMSEFIGRISSPLNDIFSAYENGSLLGSISIDGEDLEEGTAHLRWFIVSPTAQGSGIGSILLENATAFVDEIGFQNTRLWTFKGLDAARHLYEKHRFELIKESPGQQWGTEVIEQEFERKRSLDT